MKKIGGLMISAAVLLLAACGGSGTVSPGYSASPAPPPSAGAAPWPLPSDPMSLVREAGLTPATHEYFTYHVHAHLDVFVNGRRVMTPGGIGIDISDPATERFVVDGAPAYRAKGCPQPCISPLHTHDVTGVIHIEAPTRTQFTLGQLFEEWGVRLDGSCVGGYCEPNASDVVFIDGKRQTENPADILLSDHEEIAIAIGAPPPQIPAKYTFAPNEP
jgi:hypothetical protein